MKLNIFITSVLILLIFNLNSVRSQSDNFKWSFKFGGGYARMIPSGATKNWYGKEKGPQITAGLGYKSIHLKVTYSYFNGDTEQNLSYDSIVLPANSELRMVLFNLELSYEKELFHRFFVEPHLGYLRNVISSNIVDPGGTEIEIEAITGMTLGLNLIKYFKMADGFFIGPYFDISYNFIGFDRINANLTNNAFGYSFGILLKGTSVSKKEKIELW